MSRRGSQHGVENVQVVSRHPAITVHVHTTHYEHYSERLILQTARSPQRASACSATPRDHEHAALMQLPQQSQGIAGRAPRHLAVVEAEDVVVDVVRGAVVDELEGLAELQRVGGPLDLAQAATATGQAQARVPRVTRFTTQSTYGDLASNQCQQHLAVAGHGLQVDRADGVLRAGQRL